MKRQVLDNQYVVPQTDIVNFIVNMRSTIRLVEDKKLPFSALDDVLDDFRNEATMIGGDKCYTIAECVEKRYPAVECELMKSQLK